MHARLLTLLAAAALSLTAGPVPVSAAGDTDRDHDPQVTTTHLAAFGYQSTCPSGELVQFPGGSQLEEQASWTANGSTHYLQVFTLKAEKGVGERTHGTYRLTSTTRFEEVRSASGSSVQTEVIDFDLVGKHPESQMEVHTKIQTAYSSQGKQTSSSSHSTTECRPEAGR